MFVVSLDGCMFDAVTQQSTLAWQYDCVLDRVPSAQLRRGGVVMAATTDKQMLLVIVVSFIGGALGFVGCLGRCGGFGVIVNSVIEDYICIINGIDVGGDLKRIFQGMTFWGADVIGILGHTAGIFSAVDTLRVGATMIAFIGTLGYGAGGFGGSLPTGCMEIARGSGGGGRGAS